MLEWISLSHPINPTTEIIKDFTFWNGRLEIDTHE